MWVTSVLQGGYIPSMHCFIYSLVILFCSEHKRINTKKNLISSGHRFLWWNHMHLKATSVWYIDSVIRWVLIPPGKSCILYWIMRQWNVPSGVEEAKLHRKNPQRQIWKHLQFLFQISSVQFDVLSWAYLKELPSGSRQNRVSRYLLYFVYLDFRC